MNFWEATARIADMERVGLMAAYDILFEECNDLIILLDEDARIRKLGLAARDFFPAGRILEGSRFDALLADDVERARLAEALSATLGAASRDPPESAESRRRAAQAPIRFEARDGASVVVSFSIRALGPGLGWLLRGSFATSGLSRALTERPADEAARRGSTFVFGPRFDLRAVKEAVVLVDGPTRTIVEPSAGIERLFGWSREEVVGASLRIVYQGEAYFQAIGRKAAEAYARDGVFSGRVELRRRDGSSLDCSFVNFPLFRGDFRGPARIVTCLGEVPEPAAEVRVLTRLAGLAEELSSGLSRLAGLPRGLDPPTADTMVLPRRQLELVRLLLCGYSTKEMAAMTGLAESTVKNHLSAVYRKYEVSSRVELVRRLASRSPAGR